MNIELNYFDGENYTVLYPRINLNNNDGSSLNSSYIPNLSASKITSGTFDTGRIPNLSADKITSGTLPASRGGTGYTSLASLKTALGISSSTGTSLKATKGTRTGTGSENWTLSLYSELTLFIEMYTVPSIFVVNGKAGTTMTNFGSGYYINVSKQSGTNWKFTGSSDFNSTSWTYYYVAFGT